ncbi:histidine kinase [Agaricicola taiwanensis]|uniref:Histidine kinase n=1 Tax=Agaricicola taiwanensis TaxID=591372 RepID=A0A8J2YLT6_9RHOB|nr:CBS domain-containing protein [Agaricicola taiwanensis]GGE52475.1 histidine kinase [Agaricicola taiwanensis]
MLTAADVMMHAAVTASSDTSIHEVAGLIYTHGMSCVPVIDGTGRVIGIVSEGDLIGHAEVAGERQLSWWQRFVAGPSVLAHQYAKTHGITAADVMTTDVITVSETTTIAETARLLDEHHIKSVPVVRDDKMVGIVTRANLIKLLAAAEEAEPVSVADAIISERLHDVLGEQPWANLAAKNIVVQDGVVHLFGIVASDEERHAVRVAAGNVAGVKAVQDHCSMSQIGQYEL